MAILPGAKLNASDSKALGLVGGALGGLLDVFGTAEDAGKKLFTASFDGFLRSHLLRQDSAIKWNRVYPYGLRLGGKPTQDAQTMAALKAKFKEGKEAPTGTSGPESTTSGLGNIAKNLSQVTKAIFPQNWSDLEDTVTLPITPEQIEVRTPAAVNLQATLRGVSEQSNGAPFRHITIRGTTGIAPGRPLFNGISNDSVAFSTRNPATGDVLNKAFNSVNQLFSAPLARAAAFTGLNQSAMGIADSQLFNDPIQLGPVQLGNTIYSTGYWRFHQIVTFIDFYLNIKKSGGPQSKGIYMIFEMEKDELYYQCTLRNFSFTKKPGTMEYNYVIELTAWGYERKEESSSAAIRRQLRKVGQLGRQVDSIFDNARNQKSVFARLG